MMMLIVDIQNLEIWNLVNTGLDAFNTGNKYLCDQLTLPHVILQYKSTHHVKLDHDRSILYKFTY